MGKETIYILIFFCVVALLLLGAAALVGWVCRVALKLQHNYGLYVGYALAGITLYVCAYGCTVGFTQVRVTRVEMEFEDLPVAFDGYRIVHITDAHLGSFKGGRRKLFARDVDTILAQSADMIVFTGDLQNHAPSELGAFAGELARLKATDGVFAVLGNHDYGYPKTRTSPREVRKAEEAAGWTTLVNQHAVVRRGSDRIVIAGMDNDGDGKHFPRRGDMAKTLEGTSEDDFIVVLEHDPTSWRRNILKNSHAQLTLSGHTHAMQFGVCGWSPSEWVYEESWGAYSEGGRRLFVSTGVGGVLPFRFGMPREIAVVTLRRAVGD